MRKPWLFLHCLFVAAVASAAERALEFNVTDEDKTPAGFRSVVAGLGQPGDWRVAFDAVESALKPVTPDAVSTARRLVVAQKSRSIIDTHFPILIYEPEEFGDFKFSTRFKIVEGDADQMAGIVFRYRDEKNFYVLRASVRDGTLRFYKMNNGIIERLYGPSQAFELGKWYELAVECKGSQILCHLDGQEAIPAITDTGFLSGKIGFWTKSDTVAFFADARVRYTPREPAAQVLVRETLKHNPRLVGLKIIMPSGTPPEPRIVASKLESDLGQPADPSSREVLKSGKVFYGKEQGVVNVTMPLLDRNGDPVAALRITMNSLIGQTEQNAIARAQPIVKEIQQRVQSASDLIE